MATQGTQVTINGTTYYVPVAGQNPQWGPEVHDTLVALANAINSVSPSGSIPLTSFSLANNQSSPSNINGANFNISQIQSFSINYSIYRSTASVEGSQKGTLEGTFNRIAGTWDMSNEFNGSSGVVLSITNSGQIQYTSTNMSGSSYSGIIKFTAYAFTQV